MHTLRPSLSTLGLAVALFSVSSWAQQNITVDPSGVAIQNGNQAVQVHNAPAATPEPVPTTYSITGMGRTETHPCAPGESFAISGQGHTITLTGDCRSVAVSGQGHRITVEGVGAIVVSGVGNHVKWHHALDGRKPSVQSSGVGNSVKRWR